MYVAALPSGEAAVVDNYNKVVRINNTGHTVKVLYDCNLCSSISGLLLLGDNLYAVHDNGTIANIDPDTGGLFNVYHILNVAYVRLEGSLSSDPANIPNDDILVLPDYNKNEVFSYNLTSDDKQVHVTGLSSPTSVSYMFVNGSICYIVCQRKANTVSIYNSSWGLVSSFGQTGSGDGDLDEPYSALFMSSNNSIMVSEYINERISVFTSKGDFLRHFPTDKPPSPECLSYFRPYLWATHYIHSTAGIGLQRYYLDY